MPLACGVEHDTLCIQRIDAPYKAIATYGRRDDPHSRADMCLEGIPSRRLRADCRGNYDQEHT
jgi:hypothetical protein